MLLDMHTNHLSTKASLIWNSKRTHSVSLICNMTCMQTTIRVIVNIFFLNISVVRENMRHYVMNGALSLIFSIYTIIGSP